MECITYNGFDIFGIEHEAIAIEKNLDDYFSFIISKIKNQPIPEEFISTLTRNIRLVNYFGKSVFVFTIQSLNDPVIYDEKYYERCGHETVEIPVRELGNLFKRFH